MHLTSCLHPSRIRNPHTHLIEYVPCGKCDYCRMSRSSVWVQRIQQESLCWKYCYFVTLTYDDAHKPVLFYNKEDNTLLDMDTSEVIDCSEIPNFNYKDKLFLHRVSDIPRLSVRDVQLFLKRLRYFIKHEHEKRCSKEVQTLRYFCAGEYGSTTFRPHYHLLLWFNSDTTSQTLSSLL